MKQGMLWLFLILALVAAPIGCQPRNVRNGYGAATSDNTIDGYAQSHGISREEAAKRMRAQLVPPSDSGPAAPATKGN